MHLQAMHSREANTVIGTDGQTATVCAHRGGVVSLESRGRERRRCWSADASDGVRVLLPLRPGMLLPVWHSSRVSRDQMELECEVRGTDGRVCLIARQIVTVDDCGLHLALAVENTQPLSIVTRWGVAVCLQAGASSRLDVPVGTLGGGTEGRLSDSPFAWPRRSRLTHSGGDTLEVRASPPLARTEVRRHATHIELHLLTSGTLAGGETGRAECRLKATLAEAIV